MQACLVSVQPSCPSSSEDRVDDSVARDTIRRMRSCSHIHNFWISFVTVVFFRQSSVVKRLSMLPTIGTVRAARKVSLLILRNTRHICCLASICSTATFPKPITTECAKSWSALSSRVSRSGQSPNKLFSVVVMPSLTRTNVSLQGCAQKVPSFLKRPVPKPKK